MTTGDPKLDRVIHRFIHDPRTLRCDVHDYTEDYWRRGGTDGRPEPAPWTGFERVRQTLHTEPEQAFTRLQLLEYRANPETATP